MKQDQGVVVVDFGTFEQKPNMPLQRHFSARKRAILAGISVLVAAACLVVVVSNSTSTAAVPEEKFGPLSFDEVHTHILNMRMRRSQAEERLKQAALIRKVKALESQQRKADAQLGPEPDSSASLTAQLGSLAPAPAPAAAPAAAAPVAAAPVAAAPVAAAPVAAAPVAAAPVAAAPAPAAAAPVQQQAVQPAALAAQNQFVDSPAGKVQERSMADSSERAFEAYMSQKMGGKLAAKHA